uniref:Uncharacterized protein n=1 Tax=Arundo donax TaxID=35708 RepID=A0A0A9HUJ5_ARUDO
MVATLPRSLPCWQKPPKTAVSRNCTRAPMRGGTPSLTIRSNTNCSCFPGNSARDACQCS